MVHHETTTGLINPVKEIADVVDSQNRVFVWMPSVPRRETLDVAGSKIYMVAGNQENAYRVSLGCPSYSSARDSWSG